MRTRAWRRERTTTWCQRRARRLRLTWYHGARPGTYLQAHRFQVDERFRLSKPERAAAFEALLAQGEVFREWWIRDFEYVYRNTLQSRRFRGTEFVGWTRLPLVEPIEDQHRFLGEPHRLAKYNTCCSCWGCRSHGRGAGFYRHWLPLEAEDLERLPKRLQARCQPRLEQQGW
jgi:hypothetical protein